MMEQQPQVLKFASEDMSIQVVIEEKVFRLTKWHYEQMPYFDESLVLSSSKAVNQSEVVYRESYIPLDQFQIMNFIILECIKEEESQRIPIPAGVTSNNPKDSIGERMTRILDTLAQTDQPLHNYHSAQSQIDKPLTTEGLKKLQTLYHYSHYAHLKSLCNCIAAYLAAKVYFKDPEDLKKLLSKYGIAKKLSFKEIKRLKDLYSFMNY